MTTLREAAAQALEQLKINRTNFRKGPSKSICKMLAGGNDEAIADLEAALAEPVLQTCNCRWDGEVQVQQCTLHEAHVDAIHEWAERAKTAEKKLAALAEPVQEPVAWIHVPHPGNGMSQTVSLSPQREPSMYAASVPLFLREKL